MSHRNVHGVVYSNPSKKKNTSFPQKKIISSMINLFKIKKLHEN